MLRDAVLSGPRLALAADMPLCWRRPLGLTVFAWALLIGIFWRDWSAMAGQWWNISTYNHILLIPPILAWLVAQRWSELRKLVPSGWWPGLFLFAGALCIWLLGAFAQANLLRHGGAVAMLAASVVTLLGPRVALGLLFPLGYMVFLVPFGDGLIPPLQMITADITIALTQISGIPAQIEGVFIDTPAGLFEVAAACSGVKFLIGMLAFGVLLAQLCFVSWIKRAAFVALSIVVPIVANGLRAWSTIYIAQSQGIEFAASVDHVVYGFVFFAIVMALTVAIAWRFFDRAPDAPMFEARWIEGRTWLERIARRSADTRVLALALIGVACMALVWSTAAARLSAPMPAQIALPDVPGWEAVDYAPEVAWEPRASGADHRLIGRYRDASGREVDVFVALYAGQGEGREASGEGEGALVPDTPWRWLEAGAADPQLDRQWYRAFTHVRRYTETGWRHGDLLTGSNGRLRLALLADRLLMRARPTTTLILSAEGTEGAGEVAAFRRAIGPVDQWMDGIAAGL